MSHGTHSYFDWQVSTLMLAYDAVQPIGRDDEPSLATREQQVQRELHQLAHAVIPDWYLKNPSEDFPAEIVVLLTKATVARAAQILGMVEEPGDETDEELADDSTDDHSTGDLTGEATDGH